MGCMNLETELYIKPTNSGIILHASSAHPTTTKHDMVRNMFHKAFNNSTSKDKEESSVQKKIDPFGEWVLAQTS